MNWFDQVDISRRRRSLLFLVMFLLTGMLAAVGDGGCDPAFLCTSRQQARVVEWWLSSSSSLVTVLPQ